MVGKKTMIAFATKSGVTGENAKIIAGVLREDFGHEVEVVDLMKGKMGLNSDVLLMVWISMV